MLNDIGELVRERRLGSAARAGRQVRDEVRRTQWEFMRRNVGLLAAGGAVAGLVTAAAVRLAPNDFLAGSAVGAGTVFTVGGLAFTVAMLTGTGSRAMGAAGEAWTSSELRRLRRQGWKLLDHLYYRYGDVDHVLVGPGGVVVIETKWSAQAWALHASDSRIADAVRQVTANARDLRLVVPELRHRDGSVRSVLFLWGGAAGGGAQPSRPVRIGDVDVVVGTVAAKTWRNELGAASTLLEPSEIQAIWARLCEQARNTDTREAAHPPPPTLARLYWTGLSSLIAAFASVLAVVYTIRWTGSAWSGYAAAGVAIVVGGAGRRTAALRYPTLGWLTGVFAITMALIAIQIIG